MAYMRDYDKLIQFMEYAGSEKKPTEIVLKDLHEMMRWIGHRIIETDELSIEEFVSNTPERLALSVRISGSNNSLP